MTPRQKGITVCFAVLFPFYLWLGLTRTIPSDILPVCISIIVQMIFSYAILMSRWR
jgi:hypothetical protein